MTDQEFWKLVHFQNTFFRISFSVLICSFLGYFFLRQLKYIKAKRLRNFFYIPARKSATDAIQLGGLPLSLSISFGLLACLLLPDINHIFSFKQILILKRTIPISWLIIFYGFLDDRYELKPIIKLAFQFLTVLLFSISISSSLYYRNSSVAFLITFFWGIGVINGANLLDGLDSMTIKLSSVTIIGYFITAYFSGAFEIIAVGIIVFIPMATFYFFNREPSTIHLGEIGGSYFGFIMLILSALLFVHPKNISMIDNASMSIMLLSLPMVELGVSFLRRLYNKKSPFAGDRFHVHHILRNYYDLSASTTTTLMALIYFIILIPALITTQVVHSFISLLFLIGMLISSYLMIGAKYWVTSTSISLSPKNLFESMRKKDVMLIDSSKIDDFRLIILDDEIERDIEEIYDDLNDDQAA